MPIAVMKVKTAKDKKCMAEREEQLKTREEAFKTELQNKYRVFVNSCMEAPNTLACTAPVQEGKITVNFDKKVRNRDKNNKLAKGTHAVRFRSSSSSSSFGLGWPLYGVFVCMHACCMQACCMHACCLWFVLVCVGYHASYPSGSCPTAQHLVSKTYE